MSEEKKIEWLPAILDPEFKKKAGEVAKDMEWDINAAEAFCVYLLEQVNDHKMAQAINKLFVEEN